MQVTTVGIDLAKNMFRLHGCDVQGRPVLRKQLARRQLLSFVANLPRLCSAKLFGWRPRRTTHREVFCIR